VLCAGFLLDDLAVALLEALPAAVHTSGEETCDMVAPAMKKREFNFTEATRF
jgi:hypothetical protein